MTLSTLKESIRRHKTRTALVILAGLVGFFVLLVIVGAVVLLGFQTFSYEQHDMAFPAGTSGFMSEPASIQSRKIPAPEIGQDTDLEVREGTATVKSEDAENDTDALRAIVERHDGYIEEGMRRETTTNIRVVSTVRVPVDNFEALVRDIMDRFEIEDHEIRNIRIGIQRELDEMEIIQRTFEEYGRIREEIQNLPIGEEKISLLMDITEYELELASRKKQYDRQLGGKERQADLATLTLTFNQKVKAVIWPEDLGNEFRDRVHTGVDAIAKSAINTVVYSLVLIVWVVQFLVYAIIIIVPIVVVSRIGVRIYRRATRKTL